MCVLDTMATVTKPNHWYHLVSLSARATVTQQSQPIYYKKLRPVCILGSHCQGTQENPKNNPDFILDNDPYYEQPMSSGRSTQVKIILRITLITICHIIDQRNIKASNTIVLKVTIFIVITM